MHPGTSSRHRRGMALLRAGALLLVLPSFLLAPPDAHAQAPSPQSAGYATAVMERASERYDRLDALCADFTQEMRVALLNQVTRSEGRICQQDPDLLSMRFTDPAGDQVVADGEYLWMYFPSMERDQVVRQRLEGTQGRFDFHREFLADPGEKYTPTYEGRETLAGREAHVISLVPRGPSTYRMATVWIDDSDSLIRRVRIEEENGSVRTVDLRALELDPRLEPGLFRFTPPEGVRVVDGR
jgi:outer membrane lipoprotein carrier protein